MKAPLSLVFCFIIICGCKPDNRSESEIQGLGKIGKGLDNLTKTKKLADSLSIKEAVKKAVNDGELDDFKKLLKQGGDLSNEATLAYYRSIKKKKEVLFRQMDKNKKILSYTGDRALTRDEVVLIEVMANRSAEIVGEYIALVKKTTNQISEVVGSTDTNKFDVALSLCCRESKLAYSTLQKNKETFAQILNDSNNFGRTISWSSETLTASSRLDKYNNIIVLHDANIKARIAIQKLMSTSAELSKTIEHYNNTLLDVIPN